MRIEWLWAVCLISLQIIQLWASKSSVDSIDDSLFDCLDAHLDEMPGEQKVSLFISAVKRDRIDILRQIWSNDSDVIHRSKNSSKALLACGKTGNLEIFKYLLSLTDSFGNQTFLQPHLLVDLFEDACLYGHVDMVKYLREEWPKEPNGFNLNISLDNNGNRIFMLACKSGSVDLVDYLVSLNVGRREKNLNPINPVDRESKAVLIAAKKGHTALLQYFWQKIEEGHEDFKLINFSNHDSRAIILAAKNGHADTLAFLLRRGNLQRGYCISGLNPSTRNHGALLFAIQGGHLEALKVLLEVDEEFNQYHRLDATVDDNFPLRTAALHGHYQIVRFLLQRKPDGDYVYEGTDPGAFNNEALKFAIEKKYPEVAAVLLEVDEDGHPIHPLIDASVDDHYCLKNSIHSDGALLKLLLQIKPDRSFSFYPNGIPPEVISIILSYEQYSRQTQQFLLKVFDAEVAALEDENYLKHSWKLSNDNNNGSRRKMMLAPYYGLNMERNKMVAVNGLRRVAGSRKTLVCLAAISAAAALFCFRKTNQ